jgi:hypothetical protein
MRYVRLLVVGLLALGIGPTEATAQGVFNAFVQGMEAADREEEAKVTIQILQLQRDILAESYRQRLAAQQQQQRQAMRAAHDAAQRQARINAQAQSETDEAMRLFTQRRPDWRSYEAVIIGYATKMPAGQLDLQDYLDALYFLAKRDEAEAALRKAAEDQTAALLSKFGERHPDWKQYDEQMTAIAKVRPPDPGMTDMQYLEILYEAARKR